MNKERRGDRISAQEKYLLFKDFGFNKRVVPE